MTTDKTPLSLTEYIQGDHRTEVTAALGVLEERRNWLSARITAKSTIGWDVEWDTRERDALTYVIEDASFYLLGKVV